MEARFGAKFGRGLHFRALKPWRDERRSSARPTRRRSISPSTSTARGSAGSRRRCRSSTTCWRRSRNTASSTWSIGDRRRRGRPPPHRRGRGHLPGAGVPRGAGRQERHHPLRRGGHPHGRDAGVGGGGLRRPGGVRLPGRRAQGPAGRDVRRRAGARVLRRLRQHRPVQPAPRGPLRRERPPHDRGAVQGVRAGDRARRCGATRAWSGVPSTKGTLTA